MSYQTTADGTAYELHGDPDKPLIALIHGLGLCRGLWDAHLPALTRNHYVLRYDLYGHGDSRPFKRKTNLTDYANQLVGLLDHIDAPHAHLVGFSIGGMINRRFALDYPTRLSSMVIVNSPHDRGAEAQAATEERARLAATSGTMATMDAALQRWFTPDYLANGTGAAQVIEWRKHMDETSYAHTSWVLADGVKELIKPTTPITARTLVMTCENDPGSTPAMSHDIAGEIAGAETIIVPELRHLGLMEQPQTFTDAILEFLSAQQ